jgi:dihydroflavonol-4-reductase
MRAFITGATGQLGTNLVHLLLAQGWQVRALARSQAKAKQFLGNTGAEIIIGDMENVQGFAHALEGVDVVFHTAAYFREYFNIGEHWQTLKKINVDATIELMTLAEQKGVKKFIHTSSSGVIGKTANGRLGDESTPPDEGSMSNLYFKSKVLCEQAIVEWQKTHAMPVVLILPTAMIGTYDAGPTGIGEAVINIALKKFPMIPPGGTSFVDSRDVAQAMIVAVEKGKNGERYILNEAYHTMHEFAQVTAKSARVPAPNITMPYPLAMFVATMSEFGARLTGAKPLISKAAVNTMMMGHQLNSTKAQRELGFRARPFAQSIQDEVAWYKDNGFLA